MPRPRAGMWQGRLHHGGQRDNSRYSSTVLSEHLQHILAAKSAATIHNLLFSAKELSPKLHFVATSFSCEYPDPASITSCDHPKASVYKLGHGRGSLMDMLQALQHFGCYIPFRSSRRLHSFKCDLVPITLPTTLWSITTCGKPHR